LSQSACALIQNPSLIPKNLERRSAVSAVIARSPERILLIRDCGTSMFFAKR
jgi:hypothetical protein